MINIHDPFNDPEPSILPLGNVGVTFSRLLPDCLGALAFLGDTENIKITVKSGLG